MNRNKLIAILFLVAGVCQGQTLSIEEALRIAKENNQSLKAQDLEIKAAGILTEKVFELPKADVSLMFGRNEGFKYNDGITLAQSFPMPGFFKAKKELLKSQAHTQELLKEVQWNEIKHQVRSLYYQWMHYGNRQQKLTVLDTLYRDLVKIAEVRYKAGDAQKVDISTAKAKLGETTLLIHQNDVLLENTLVSLRTLLGSEQNWNLPNDEYKPLGLASMGSLDVDHPLIQSAKQEIEVLTQSQGVEKAGNLPELSFSYTNASLIGPLEKDGEVKYYGRGQRFGYVDVGVSFPLTYGATKNRVQSLELRKKAIEQVASQRLYQLEGELKAAVNQYNHNLANYQYYVNEALANADEILSASKLSHKTGDTSFIEYIFALSTATDIQLKHLDAIHQLNQSVVFINSLTNQ